MSINANAIDAEYYKKMKLINSVTSRVSEYLRLGLENMTIEIHVSDMELSTIKVNTNPLKIKLGTVCEKHIRDVVENIEFILWRTLNMNKTWFVLKFEIKDGNIDQNSIDCRFTVQQNTKGRA